jgi:hypothetical protein
VLPSITALIDWIRATIDRDPLLLLPYVLFIEYLTVRLGPRFVEAVRSIGIPKDALTVISNHAVLDKDHVLNDFQMAEQITANKPLHAALFRETVSRAASLYGAFLTEVAGGSVS